MSNLQQILARGFAQQISTDSFIETAEQLSYDQALNARKGLRQYGPYDLPNFRNQGQTLVLTPAGTPAPYYQPTTGSIIQDPQFDVVCQALITAEGPILGGDLWAFVVKQDGLYIDIDGNGEFYFGNSSGIVNFLGKCLSLSLKFDIGADSVTAYVNGIQMPLVQSGFGFVPNLKYIGAGIGGNGSASGAVPAVIVAQGLNDTDRQLLSYGGFLPSSLITKIRNAYLAGYQGDTGWSDVQGTISLASYNGMNQILGVKFGGHVHKASDILDLQEVVDSIHKFDDTGMKFPGDTAWASSSNQNFSPGTGAFYIAVKVIPTSTQFSSAFTRIFSAGTLSIGVAFVSGQYVFGIQSGVDGVIAVTDIVPEQGKSYQIVYTRAIGGQALLWINGVSINSVNNSSYTGADYILGGGINGIINQAQQGVAQQTTVDCTSFDEKGYMPSAVALSQVTLDLRSEYISTSKTWEDASGNKNHCYPSDVTLIKVYNPRADFDITSDGVKNESLIPVNTVTEALDELFEPVGGFTIVDKSINSNQLLQSLPISTNDFTFAVKFKPTSIGVWNPAGIRDFVACLGQVSLNCFAITQNYNGSIQVVRPLVSPNLVLDTHTPSILNEVNNVLLVRRSGVLYVYVNSQDNVVSVANTNSPVSSPISIGCPIAQAGTPSSFGGTVYNLLTATRALTVAEIKEFITRGTVATLEKENVLYNYLPGNVLNTGYWKDQGILSSDLRPGSNTAGAYTQVGWNAPKPLVIQGITPQSVSNGEGTIPVWTDIPGKQLSPTPVRIDGQNITTTGKTIVGNYITNLATLAGTPGATGYTQLMTAIPNTGNFNLQLKWEVISGEVGVDPVSAIISVRCSNGVLNKLSADVTWLGTTQTKPSFWASFDNGLLSIFSSIVAVVNQRTVISLISIGTITNFINGWAMSRAVSLPASPTVIPVTVQSSAVRAIPNQGLTPEQQEWARENIGITEDTDQITGISFADTFGEDYFIIRNFVQPVNTQDFSIAAEFITGGLSQREVYVSTSGVSPCIVYDPTLSKLVVLNPDDGVVVQSNVVLQPQTNYKVQYVRTSGIGLIYVNGEVTTGVDTNNWGTWNQFYVGSGLRLFDPTLLTTEGTIKRVLFALDAMTPDDVQEWNKEGIVSRWNIPSFENVVKVDLRAGNAVRQNNTLGIEATWFDTSNFKNHAYGVNSGDGNGPVILDPLPDQYITRAEVYQKNNTNVILGVDAHSPATANLVVIGSNADSEFEDSVVIGTDATAHEDSGGPTQRSTAVGFKSKVLHANSGAFGQLSQTRKVNSIAFGTVGQERQLTNIAAGTDNTDAATVAQVNQKVGSDGSVTQIVIVSSPPTTPTPGVVYFVTA